jgi:hypothetical protein
VVDAVVGAAAPRLLVLVESQGNQPYVFSTNRVRLMVGGSEHLYRVGSWAVEYVHGAGSAGGDAVERAGVLLVTAPSGGIELVVATSGKVVAVADDASEARGLVSALTSRALVEAPMMDLCGVVVPQGEGEHLCDTYDRAVRELASVRAELPAASGRFPLHPFVEPCGESGLPVSAVRRVGGGRRRVSVDVEKRLDAADGAALRLAALAAFHGARLARTLTDLDAVEEELGRTAWTAVVHADGNGVGSVFAGLGNRFGASSGRPAGADVDAEYVDFQRRFSLALEVATEDAFFAAVASAGVDGSVVPLVLGGDDATFVCDAAVALDVTACFLDNFRSYTADPELSPRLGGTDPHRILLRDALREGVAASGVGEAFGMAAGVAVTKPHHPFHSGYALAEQLLSSAKRTKSLGLGTTALDFHVLFDSVGSDLGAVRSTRRSGDVDLHAGPYLVSGVDPDRDYVPLHDLVAAADALGGGDRRRVNALLHRLRSALADSPHTALALFDQYVAAGQFGGDDELLETVRGLVEHRAAGRRSVATLLDVLDLEPLGHPRRGAGLADADGVSAGARATTQEDVA